MSKNSGIGHVWAANVGEDGRPNGVGPVWIENISAIGGGGGSIPSEVSGKWEDASNCVESNSASWAGGSVSLPLTGSSNNTTATYDSNSAMFDYIETQGEPTRYKISVKPDEGHIEVYYSNDEDQTNTTVTIGDNCISFKDQLDNYQEIYGENIGYWNDTYNTVLSNSSNWGGGSTGDLSSKLDASAVSFRNYGGTYYVSAISGKQVSARYAYSANNAGNAVESQYAYTAYYDENGNNVTAGKDAWNTVNANSANWGGGSSPTGNYPNVLFDATYYDYGNGSNYAFNAIRNNDANTVQIKFCVESEYQPSDVTIGNQTYTYWQDGSGDQYPIWAFTCDLPAGDYIVTNNTFSSPNSAIISRVSAYGDGGGWKFMGINSMNFTTVNNGTELELSYYDPNMGWNFMGRISNGSSATTGYDGYATYVYGDGGYPRECAYSATFPVPAVQVPIEIVSNSAAATGTNILYVVTGSSN